MGNTFIGSREARDNESTREFVYRKAYWDGFEEAIRLLNQGAELRQLSQYCDTELFEWRSGNCNEFTYPPVVTPWRKLRDDVLKRDGGRCVYCGAEATHVDHIIPVSRGGTYRSNNLVAACRSCNLSKGASTARHWIKAAKNGA